MKGLNYLSKLLGCLILMTFFIGEMQAQIITDKTAYDFGEITKDDKKYVDFKFTNASDKTISILRYETPYGVAMRFSGEHIEPDESILVRIKYTPKRKGEFSADIPVYVSSNNEPITLSIRGKAMSFDYDESIIAPDFEKSHEEKADETFELDIKVIRADDKSPIEKARLDVIWDGVMYKNLNTKMIHNYIEPI